MRKLFNPLDYQIIFNPVHRLSKYSFGQEHVPYVMCLAQLLRPRVFVELSTSHGDPYYAFCQAVKELKLETRCYAVGNWQSDVHPQGGDSTGEANFRESHDRLYGSFSSLALGSFEAALQYFADKSIDLLVMGEARSCSEVKQAFFSWLPKLSNHGVVLIHNTNAVAEGREIGQFFDEIKNSYPHFEFLYGHGLGVLAVGGEQPTEFLAMLKAEEKEAEAIRQLFSQLGQSARLAEAQAERPETLINYLETLLSEREQVVQRLHTELFSLTESKAWIVFQKLYNVRERLKANMPFSRATVVSPPPAPKSALANGSKSEVKILSEPLPIVNERFSALASSHTLDVIQTLLNRSREVLRGLKADDVRVIAFYLPQYHPIPENDRWWGKGFTEWTNVAKARPNFEGHYQPHLPTDLGFYDLRVPEVREHQAQLAREYGVHGFCYHHYWFGGKRLLERPFNEVLSTGRPDFPFCICWANENWTRRWDGAEREILMGQNHSDQDDRNFIRSLFPAFEDRRYIRVNGKPLLIVYRVNILPNAQRTANIWREEVRAAGLGEIYLCAAQSFGLSDPMPYGFEAAVEFPPHGPRAVDLVPWVPNLHASFAGAIHDYTAKANSIIHRPVTEYTLFKSVMPAWDNTPRRQEHSIVYINSSPEAYEYWLGKAVELMITRYSGDERLVFINAWNEWGEGAHLEPDRQHGHRYLEATRNVLDAVRNSL